LGLGDQAQQELARGLAWLNTDPPAPEAADEQWPLACLALLFTQADVRLHLARWAPGDAALAQTARLALQSVVDERARLQASGTLANIVMVWRSELAAQKLLTLTPEH
jgi:hypothetical protein